MNIFSKPEEIDAVIKSKLEQFPCKGGTTSSRKVSWSQSEIELIDAVIMNYIAEQGLSRERTAQQIMERWGVNISTARRYVKECIDRFASSFEDDTDKLRKVWMERCEAILTDAIESRQKDSALKALDMLGKSLGLYKDNVSISGGDNPIKFDFS